MVLEQEFDQALQDLVKEEKAQIRVGGETVFMKVEEEATIATLTTCVYMGSGYLPESVKQAMSHKFPQMRPFHTSLYMDDKSHSIHLHFRGSLEGVSKKQFKHHLEEFASIADDWRDWFDDHDKKDRIHVRRK